MVPSCLNEWSITQVSVVVFQSPGMKIYYCSDKLQSKGFNTVRQFTYYARAKALETTLTAVGKPTVDRTEDVCTVNRSTNLS